MNPNATLIVLSVVMAALILTARHSGKYRQSRNDDAHIVQHLSHELDLAPSQKPVIEAILADLTALKSEGGALRHEWYTRTIEQLSSESNATPEPDTGNKQLAARIEELGNRFSAAPGELKNNLSPEQRLKLVAALAKHDNRRHTR